MLKQGYHTKQIDIIKKNYNEIINFSIKLFFIRGFIFYMDSDNAESIFKDNAHQRDIYNKVSPKK